MSDHVAPTIYANEADAAAAAKKADALVAAALESFEQRDWAEWDLEHPYVPHPKDSISDPVHDAADHIVASNESLPFVGDTGDKFGEEGQDWTYDHVMPQSIKDNYPDNPHDELFEDEEIRGQMKVQVASDIAAGMDRKYDESLVNWGSPVYNNGPDSLTMYDCMQGKVPRADEGKVLIVMPDDDGRLSDWEFMDKNTINPDRVAAGEYYPATSKEGQDLIRSDAVSHYVAKWAGTSNDSSAESLAMQDAVQREFGLKDAEAWAPPANAPLSLESNIKDYTQKNGDMYQNLFRTVYNNTQKTLQNQGIGSIPVCRGFAWENGEIRTNIPVPIWAEKNGESEVPLRPMSSFSTDNDTAKEFAGEHGAVIYGHIPTNRILSLASTGPGCLSEHEIVVLSGPGKWTVEDYDTRD